HGAGPCGPRHAPGSSPSTRRAPSAGGGRAPPHDGGRSPAAPGRMSAMTPAAPPDPPAVPARTRRPGAAASILAALVAFHGIVLLPALWRDTLAVSIEGSPDWDPWRWTFANPARLLLSPALLVVLAALLVAVLAVLLARRAPRFAAWGS